MKKVLYLTNIEVPYRVRFFNELAKHCDLTVLYEKTTVESRNKAWAKSQQTVHNRAFLKREGILFTGILKQIRQNYDVIIVGCYNTPVQMVAMLYMRLMRIPFLINLDGEPFLQGNGMKSRMKRFFLSGAQSYLVAGEKAAESLTVLSGSKNVMPYSFSSLSKEELDHNKNRSEGIKRDDTVLVIAQNLAVKGVDVALEAARMDPSIHYRFVGMGSRTELFVKEHEISPNVEIIPFLQRDELEKEYLTCGMLLLPSRQECWGLVINEAASFGMPIVSTWGSGAAMEFLADEYPQFLAKPGDAEMLLRCIQNCIQFEYKDAYRKFLIEKSEEYSIEKSVHQHMAAISDR